VLTIKGNQVRKDIKQIRFIDKGTISLYLTLASCLRYSLPDLVTGRNFRNGHSLNASMYFRLLLHLKSTTFQFVYFSNPYLSRKLNYVMKRSAITSFLIATALLLTHIVFGQKDTTLQAGLLLPRGFTTSIVAQGIDGARHMAVTK